VSLTKKGINGTELLYQTSFISRLVWNYDFEMIVTAQIGKNVSIILTCVPFLRSVLDNLHPEWSTSAHKMWARDSDAVLEALDPSPSCNGADWL
jgi:hypothetical protein